jgi:lipoprotein signal peptidase
MIKNNKCHFGWIAFSMLWIIIDQITKYLAVNHLAYGEPKVILPVLNFTLSFNNGAAFGMFNDQPGWQIIFFSVLFFCLITLICALVLFIDLRKSDLKLGATEWLFLLIFPIISILYYGFNFRVFGSFNLRSIGLIKPFIIGFVWAGLVCIYPEMLYNIQNGLHYKINLISLFLFFKNLIFISVLCIMFDIKDYAMDHNQKLKTFVVKIGLRKTIFYIIIPLCILCLIAGLFYDLNQQFKITKQLLNTVPFILTIIVAYFLKFRKSIFYYLIIIDGLMVIKACFGITTELLF